MLFTHESFYRFHLNAVNLKSEMKSLLKKLIRKGRGSDRGNNFNLKNSPMPYEERFRIPVRTKNVTYGLWQSSY